MPAVNESTLRGELGFDVPLNGMNSWRVGGPAQRLYRPADLDDLLAFLRSGRAQGPLTWLGLGSNVLVRDGGIVGTVIALHGALETIERLSPKRVRVEAGVPCAKAARVCARWGLIGAEFLAGIPGTMGGALAMNAGAFGGETWDLVRVAETVDGDGGVHVREPEAFEVGYRSVRGPGKEWFVAAHLELQEGDPETALATIRRLLRQRGDTQPTGAPTCGSVFRNPQGDYAGRLIEACGLKGHCIGGACVSEKHANFIVNTGSARASDIEALIEYVGARVEQRFQIRLIPEVRILGEVAQ